MIKLSIPFTIDNLMLSMVKEDHLKYVDEIYMPVPYSILESARPYNNKELEEYEKNVASYVKQAKSMGLKVSFIANKQFIPHEKLRSTCIRLCKFLKNMKELYDIDKVVLSNFYIINQYGEHIKEMGINVELSITVGVDSYQSFQEILTTSPCISSVCLSDKMIHKLDEIKAIKNHFSGVELKVIPNHGCLVGCPFERQHHHYLSSTIQEPGDDVIQNSINAELNVANEQCTGCKKYLRSKERVLKEISFIRPEDINIYNESIDTLKISGRDHPAEEIIAIVEAYGNQTFDGHIEKLLDLSMDKEHGILNEQLPKEFGSRRSNCGNQCYKCNYCDITSQFVKSRSNKQNIEV